MPPKDKTKDDAAIAATDSTPAAAADAAAREEAELQAMIDAENAEKAAAAQKSENDTNDAPSSTVATLAKLGQDEQQQPPVKSEAQIAADLQAAMAARIAGGDAPAIQRDDESVIVTVPKNYFLRLDNQQLVAIKAGTQRLPRSQAEHPYSKANGVKLFEEEAGVPEDVYATASADIVAGKFTVDYASPQMASHYRVDVENVRAELTARVEKLKGAQ